VLCEVRVRVSQKGCRTKQLVVVTTLLDAEDYPRDQIAELYRRRWQAELHLRSIKTVLQMDHLRCKTPHRVRNEFFMHLVGYNLIRGEKRARKGDAAFCSARPYLKVCSADELAAKWSYLDWATVEPQSSQHFTGWPFLRAAAWPPA
jgi:hypothetical protein